MTYSLCFWLLVYLLLRNALLLFRVKAVSGRVLVECLVVSGLGYTNGYAVPGLLATPVNFPVAGLLFLCCNCCLMLLSISSLLKQLSDPTFIVCSSPFLLYSSSSPLCY